MRQILAVAVLGASLAFTASAALADDRGGVFEPVSQLTQSEIMGPDTDSPLSVIAGPTGSVPEVDVTHEGSNR